MSEPSGAATSPASASSTNANETSALTRIDLSGRQIGEFKLLRRLGRGGMAEVYLAEQTSLGRQVALKMLRSEFVEDPTYVKRFQHEASAAGGLNHPNIVQVYLIGVHEGTYFIAQEYVQGRNLKELLQKRGPLDLARALHVLRQIAQALQVAGQAGIVHRDIKPENILLTPKGEVKVADFGLAQLHEGEHRVNLTQEGVTMGTPLYMSPEQVQGKPLDCRSDLYSFGVMAYTMFAGRNPFLGPNPLAIAVQHLNEQAQPLGELRPDLPAPVCDLIHRLMAKRREDRPADAAAVLAEIKKLIKEHGSAAPSAQSVPSMPARPSPAAPSFLAASLRRQFWPLLGATLLTGLLAAGVGWLLRTGDPFLAPAQAAIRVPRQSTAQGQYFYAVSRGNEEEPWRAVVEYWGSEPSGSLECMRAEMRLGLIALSSGRLEEAREIFTRFISAGDSGDFWRKAHGLAGMAIYESLSSNTAASRDFIARLEQVPAEQRKIDSTMSTALDEARARNDGRPPRFQPN